MRLNRVGFFRSFTCEFAVIDQIASGFVAHLTFWALFFSITGVAMGLLFGAMPGLNQGVLMALTLPLTFYMNSDYAQFLLIGMYVGGVAGSMVTSITLGIPGSPSSVMTTLDGHGMAKQGRASEALALGVTASFVGGMLSWIVLATVSVPLARFAITLTSFEFSALIFGGLLMIASAGGGSIWKGLVSGFLGILVALVGLDPVSSEPRFTFGIEKFDKGFSIFPVMLGIFAIGNLIGDIGKQGEPTHQIDVKLKDILKSVGGAFRYWGNLIRSSFIGTWIGILPGIGANIGSVIAYTVTRNLSRTPEKFGTGAEEGVIASEAGNNSSVGGALIPMITLGVPGSTADVILMAALIFHNIEPGPLMMFEHEDTFFGIVATYFIANIFMFVLLLATCRYLGRLGEIPRHILAPTIFVLAVIGVYAINNLLFDVWVMLAFGAVGMLMRWVSIPAAPFVIGYVLTPLLEVKLRSSLMESEGSWMPFITRPLTLTILIASLAFVLFPVISRMLRSRSDAKKQSSVQG